MNVKVTITEIMSNCCNLGDALDVLGYSMEGMVFMDFDEADLRMMISKITGSIECLKLYQDKISNDLDAFLDNFLKENPDKLMEASQKEKEERLLWVYRHMKEEDKGQLDSYCTDFHLDESEDKEEKR